MVVDVEWDGERDEGIVWQRIGEGRSISSLFPQRIHKTRSTPRELATVILHTWLDTSRSPSQRQRAPLSSFVRSPRLHGSFAESRLLFLHYVMNASNWNSCIPGTSRKGTCHCEAPKFISLANSSIQVLSRPFYHPDFFSSQRANPALLSLSPTLNEPAQKFFFQFHLSTQNSVCQLSLLSRPSCLPTPAL